MSGDGRIGIEGRGNVGLRRRAAIAMAALVLGAGTAWWWLARHAAPEPAPSRGVQAPTTAPRSDATAPDASRAAPPGATRVPPPAALERAALRAVSPEPGVAKPLSPLEAAGFILPEHPRVQREWLAPSAPVALDAPQLVAYAEDLERRVLEGDQFRSQAAMGTLEPEHFETLVAALAAQARDDPGAAELAANFRARLERQYREGNGPARVDRLVCGLRLCVSQETTFGDGRGGTLGVGTGRIWHQPDGTSVRRTLTSVERGIPHHVRAAGNP